MHHDDFTKGLRGEFRGDFSRDTFDPLRHFSRVLMQQGRVQLDADWNEQVSIHSHFLRTLAADLIGPHGAPREPDGEVGTGFKIEKNENFFTIGHGHYYVNGILCQNSNPHGSEKSLAYNQQPDYPVSDEKIRDLEGDYLVYLDVWERHLSYVEDDYMREKALGGPDTATRAKIIWQVKLIELDDGQDNEEIKGFKTNHEKFLAFLKDERKKYPGTGCLRAKARKALKDNKDPCLISPDATYRGPENQLYRVEIHNGGEIRNTEDTESNNPVTFKWSRENGSVIFPIVSTSGKDVTLEHLGRDTRFGLKPNDWVEIVDDDYILQNRTEDLLQVDTVDRENSRVTLKGLPKYSIQEDSDKHPYLRRWDQKDGDVNGVLLREGSGKDGWLELEDGVEIQFLTPGECEQEEVTEEPNAHIYQTGDYWLIPARTATGDVEWPGTKEAPEPLPSHGVEHHYAPLAKITVDKNGDIGEPMDLRRKVQPNWK